LLGQIDTTRFSAGRQDEQPERADAAGDGRLLLAAPAGRAPISIATTEPARAVRRDDRQAPEQSNDLGLHGKWIGGEAKGVRPREVAVGEGSGGAGSPVDAAAAVAAPELPVRESPAAPVRGGQGREKTRVRGESRRHTTSVFMYGPGMSTGPRPGFGLT
jgi:hypothetical protein